MAADKTTPAAKKPSPVKNSYLILYNAVSAMLWLTVLGRIVGINAVRGPQFAYPAVGEFCKWTQTLAGMEVLHSLFGKAKKAHNPNPNTSTIQPRHTHSHTHLYLTNQLSQNNQASSAPRSPRPSCRSSAGTRSCGG